jgi:hypothetical protein
MRYKTHPPTHPLVHGTCRPNAAALTGSSPCRREGGRVSGADLCSAYEGCSSDTSVPSRTIVSGGFRR